MSNKKKEKHSTELLPSARKPQLPKEFIGSAGLPLGTESIEPEDIILPRIRIIQPQSQDREEGEGKLRNSVTGEIYEEISFIPLMLIKGRLHFPEDEMFSPPDCRSADRIIGTGQRLEQLGLTAQFCGISGARKWLREQRGITGKEDLTREIQKLDEEGKICHLCDGFPPECAESLEYPILFDNTLCALSFKRTALSEAKRFNTIVKLRHIPFFFVKVTLTTKFTKGKKGQFYVPKLALVSETSEEERSLALKYVRELTERKVEVDYSIPEYVKD